MKRLARFAAFAIATIAAASLTSGCEDATADGSTADDGSRRGELVIYQADNFETGATTFTYALRDAAGVELPLKFDSRPGLEAGTRIKAWGETEGDALRVTSFSRVSEPTATLQSALIGATPFAPRTFAFILVDIGGGLAQVRWDNTMHDVTSDFVMGRLINDDDSLRNYYLGDSYQMQDITAKVIGPLTYTPNACDTTAMATALKSQVDAQGGPFQHYLWYYGTKNSSCNWSGLASVGSPDKPQKNTWYNASVGCVVLIQEPGHNFGMQHSSSLDCGTATLADDPNGCTASEYGDSYDPMGGGCRHMNAWQKAYQGWLSGTNGVKVTNSGTFNLLPIEMSCNGTQVLQIKAPHPRPFNRPAAGGGTATTENLDYYYLELRTPVDFDGTLGGSALSARVLVHMAADFVPRTGKGLHTFLLDMNPSTSSFDALPAGQTYTDPAGGLSFTVQSVSNSGATIVVDYSSGGTGSATAMDGSAFTAPGPGIESCSGTVTPTGMGGTMGAGGRGGTTGTAGRGGTTGTAGTTGSAGVSGGVAGMPGTGSAGTGDEGTAGQGGSTTPIGTGGSPGTGGTAPMDRGVTGGCACDTAGTGSSSGLAAMLALLAFAAVTRSQPRRRLARNSSR
jgi:MYXO-CTERM domain-containing protein